MHHVRLTLLVLCAWLALPAAAAAQCDATVDTYADLKTAVEACTDAADDGSVINIDAGTYTNSATAIILQNRPGASGVVTVQTTGGCPDRRLTEDDLPALAHLQIDNTTSEIFVTEANANGWRIQCIAFGATGTTVAFAINVIGGLTESDEENRAEDIYFDRVLMPSQTLGLARQFTRVALVENFQVTRSHCGDILVSGTDTQCFAMVNAYCAPCVFDDNYLGDATEIIIAGGGDPAVTDLNPTDITITDNTFYRSGANIAVHKHHIEMKQGVGGYIARNTFTNNPYFAEDHPTAPAVFFSPRNQSGGCDGCQVAEWLVENNLFINVGQGVQVVGTDDINTSEDTYDITVRNNVIEATGACFQVGHSPDQVVFDNNTCVYVSSLPNEFMALSNAAMVIGDSLSMDNNVIYTGNYGLNSDVGGDGETALDNHFTVWTMTGNIIYGLELAEQTFLEDWPDGNTFISKATLEGEMINFAAKNYCLSPSSVYFGKGADCSQIPSLSDANTPRRLRFRVAE